MKRYIRADVDYSTLIPYSELGPYIVKLHWYKHELEPGDGSAYPYIAYRNKIIAEIGGPGPENNIVDCENSIDFKNDVYTLFLATDGPLSNAVMNKLELTPCSMPKIDNEFQFKLAVQYYYSGYPELRNYKRTFEIPEDRDPDTGLVIPGYVRSEPIMNIDKTAVRKFKSAIKKLINDGKIPRRNSIISLDDPYYGKSFWKVNYYLDDEEIQNIIDSHNTIDEAIQSFVSNYIVLTEYGVGVDDGVGFGDMVGEWEYSSAKEAKEYSTD